MSPQALALVGFVVTLGLCPLVLAVIRHRVLDEPNRRSLHATPTPRGGGLAVAGGALVGVSLMSATSDSRAALLLAGVGLGLIGLLDDLRHVPVLPRLAGQVLVSALALPWLLRHLTGPASWRVLFAAGVILWLVSYVNAFNFMDGINGIAAAQAGVAGVALGIIGLVKDVPALGGGGLLIAACAAGFAPFNVPRARMFLGDVGSYFIGGWLAVLIVIGLRAGLSPEAVISPVAVALADTLSTIVRRLRRGERLHEAHSEHTYQQLVHAGWSHPATSAFVGAVAVASSVVGAVTIPFGAPPFRGLADLAIAGILVAYLASPRLLGQAVRGREPAQGRDT